MLQNRYVCDIFYITLISYDRCMIMKKQSSYHFSEQRNIKWKRIIFTVLMISWMVIIFCFSSRDADLSTQDSNTAGIFIGQHFIPGFENWPREEQLQFAERIDHPVRKTAHAVEYAVLGALAFGAAGFIVLLRRRWWTAWLIAVIYAASDEIHQFFVPGRACMFRDVVLDSAGTLAGIAAALLIRRMIRRKVSGRLTRK